MSTSAEISLLDNVKDMMAEGTQLQTFLGIVSGESAARKTSAAARIWLEVAHRSQFVYPGVILEGVGFSHGKDRSGLWDVWLEGEVVVTLKKVVTGTGNMTNLFRGFMNEVRLCKAEFMAATQSNSRVQFRAVTEMDGPFFDDQVNEQMMAQGAAGSYAMAWGWSAILQGHRP